MKSLYETDFYAWTQEQVKLLKEQAWHHLDVLNLIEELYDVRLITLNKNITASPCHRSPKSIAK